MTAWLIPAFFGMILLVCGVLADNDKLRKHVMHLAAVVETVQKKFGGRAKLISTLGETSKKAKDKDFLAHLDTLSLPRLLDLATSSQRRAKQA